MSGSSGQPYWQYIWITPSISFQAPTARLWSSSTFPKPAPGARNTLWDQLFAPTLSVGTTVALHSRGDRGFELSAAGGGSPFFTANFFQPLPPLNPADPKSQSPCTGTQVQGNGQAAYIFFNKGDKQLAANAQIQYSHLFAGTSRADVNQFAPSLGASFQVGFGEHAQFGLGVGLAFPYAWGPGTPSPTISFAASLSAGFSFSPFPFP
jgi:hypothetical protein